MGDEFTCGSCKEGLCKCGMCGSSFDFGSKMICAKQEGFDIDHFCSEECLDKYLAFGITKTPAICEKK